MTTQDREWLAGWRDGAIYRTMQPKTAAIALANASWFAGAATYGRENLRPVSYYAGQQAALLAAWGE